MVKYYWETLQSDLGSYVEGCDFCLTSKTVGHRHYRDLQSLPIPSHWWKDLTMDFVTGSPIPANWIGDSYYYLIFVIVDRLMKMVHYEPVQIERRNLPAFKQNN